MGDAAGPARDAAKAVRPLDRLTSADSEVFGREAADIAALLEAGLPICPGWVISLDVASTEVARLLEDALRSPTRPSDSKRPPPGRRCIRLRPWYRTAALAARAAPGWPEQPDRYDPRELQSAIAALWAELRAAEEARVGGFWVRALRCDEGPFGSASSVSPEDGDPSAIAVWLPGQRPWTLDRATVRVIEPGQGPLPRTVLERVADLADRTQLALGRPVEIDWALADGRVVLCAVRSIAPAWRFADEPSRLVSLLWHDEGPIAPLAVDALDKALREESDARDEWRVHRVFARAYRKIEVGRARRPEHKHPLTAAAVRAARVMRDVARPIGAAGEFMRTLDDRLAAFDADDLGALGDDELARALRERQRVVIEAEELLDRSRKATAAVIGALEAALGTIPSECVEGLAAIRRTRTRRKLDERLVRAAREIGSLPRELDPVPAALRPRFAELRRELAGLRPLGLDVRPASYGASDAALAAGMRAALEGRGERAEQAQRSAIRRLLVTARERPLGAGRAALARTLTLMIERLAEAKGTVADGLAAAHLRVRDVAVEIGRRLVERGVLDHPEDALYLYVHEIQEALSNEPGAYVARVRLRREEDARWRSFEPPVRLVAPAAPPRRPSWPSA